MKEDHIAQLDNQASLFRRMLQRPQCKTVDVLATKASAKTTGIPISLVNDNNGNILNTNNYLLGDILDALCFDSFSTEEDNKRVFNMESNIMPFVSSPIRRRRSSFGTSQRSRRKYYSPRRISLPVILEQEDSAILVSTSPSSSPQRGRSKSKRYRRYSFVSDATNGCRDEFQSVRRKYSNVLLRLDQPKDKSILANDFDIASDGRATTQATFYGSRHISDVYSVVPIKSHLPHYGFVVQRNPCTPPLRNTKQRRRSNVVIAACPHQVCRKTNTTTLDINRKLPKTKLEKQGNVQNQGEATSRRRSLRADALSKRTNGKEAAALESASYTVGASSSYPSSQESSSSENTSDEWTSDSSGSDSDDNVYENDEDYNESDDDCDTDSSYTTTTTSSSTSSSSDSDSSSSDDSSSDESSSDVCDTSMSGIVSHSLFHSSSASTCSFATGVFENPHQSRNAESFKSRRKDDSSFSRSSIPHSSRRSEKSETTGRTRCPSRSDKLSSSSSTIVSTLRKTSLKSEAVSKPPTFSKSRSTSRSSFSRSSSSSPVKSRRKSRSPTSSSRHLESVSSSLKCVPRRTHSSSPSARHSPVRKDNGNSHMSRFRGDYIDLDMDINEPVDKEFQAGYVP